jgi:hypothetical protein
MASVITESETASSFAWARLEDQLQWYDAKTGTQKNGYLGFKVVQIVVAAVIPVFAGVAAPAWLIGGLGALIVVLEGFQQLFQYQQNWIRYRATAEALKHEKYLYLSEAGPYKGVAAPDVLLAERVEGLVSQEHSAWSSTQSEASAGQGG